MPELCMTQASSEHEKCGLVQDENPAAVRFYSGAVRRITRTMPFIASIATVALAVRLGLVFTCGFLLGCLIAYLNFRWLERGVNALADRVTASGKPQSSAGIVLRFLLRYALIAFGCYVIFRVSVTALFGLLVGLFLPVAAITCEAAYEVFVALRKDL